MKILFLDMDGAGANSDTLIMEWINHKQLEGFSKKEVVSEYRKTFCDGLEAIFPEKSNLVKKIIESTGAKIVWSTDWRKYHPYLRNIEAAKEMLDRHDMCGYALIGYTPDFGHYDFRGNEIRQYLFNAKGNGMNIEKSAVLDDREDAGFNLPENCKFFKTRTSIGVTEEIANAIIDYFNE